MFFRAIKPENNGKTHGNAYIRIRDRERELEREREREGVIKGVEEKERKHRYNGNISRDLIDKGRLADSCTFYFAPWNGRGEAF